jgi:hypothetical protein
MKIKDTVSPLGTIRENTDFLRKNKGRSLREVVQKELEFLDKPK